MQAIERVSPVEVNGIEFYVSASGKDSGLSVTAVAKLAGINHSTVSRAIVQETMPKWLESLQGELLHSCMTNLYNSRATIVTTKAASRIIRYYAYEAKQTNQTAKDNFDKFSEVGLHTWVLHMTGFKTTEDLLPVETNSLAGMKAVVELAQKYINQQEVLQDQPGLKSIMDKYSESKSNVLPPAKVTLKEYLASKGVELNKSEMSTVSQIVAGTYKAHRGCYPEQVSFHYITPNGKKANALVHGYQVDDYALIDAALELLKIA